MACAEAGALCATLKNRGQNTAQRYCQFLSSVCLLVQRGRKQKNKVSTYVTLRERQKFLEDDWKLLVVFPLPTWLNYKEPVAELGD